MASFTRSVRITSIFRLRFFPLLFLFAPIRMSVLSSIHFGWQRMNNHKTTDWRSESPLCLIQRTGLERDNEKHRISVNLKKRRILLNVSDGAVACCLLLHLIPSRCLSNGRPNVPQTKRNGAITIPTHTIILLLGTIHPIEASNPTTAAAPLHARFICILCADYVGRKPCQGPNAKEKRRNSDFLLIWRPFLHRCTHSAHRRLVLHLETEE